MSVHNEVADQVVAKIHESVRYGEGPAGAVSLELQGKLVEMLTDALAVERGIGASGAIRLGLTDDHQVCGDQKREAVAAERRVTVERLRSRIRGRDITYATRRFLENILDEEAAR